MSEKPRVSLSMGVVSGWLPEGLQARLLETLDLVHAVSAHGVYGACGIELMCRHLPDIDTLNTVLQGNLLSELGVVALRGGEISLHAPRATYVNGGLEETEALRGIATLHDRVGFHHVIFHGGWLNPGDHVKVQNPGFPVAFENDDSLLPSGHRTVDELLHLSDSAPVVIDVGHVEHHFGDGAAAALEEMIQRLGDRVAGYHVSSAQKNGWHRPMQGTAVETLLDEVPLNGAVRVIESPVAQSHALVELFGELAIATAHVRV